MAFPNISTGIYGYPKPDACTVALDAVTAFLRADPTIERVTFVCFDEENYALYRQAMQALV